MVYVYSLEWVVAKSLFCCCGERLILFASKDLMQQCTYSGITCLNIFFVENTENASDIGYTGSSVIAVVMI